MTKPRVSVVLPMRNAATTIERAVRSILNSTLRELELIVIDDGSDDGSAEVVRKIPDPRLRLLKQESLGVCSAANLGTAKATAPLIARMDADDISHPTRIEKQLSLLYNSGKDLVGCRVRIIDALGQTVESMQRYERWSNSMTEPNQIAAMRFVELPIVNPTLLAKREVFELGYREGNWPEDYDLCLRALGQGHTAAKVPEVLFDWIDSDNRLTRTDARYSPEAFDCCRKMHLLNGPLTGKNEIDLWGAGQTGKPWLRWLQAEGFTVRHVVEVSPKKIGSLIHGVPVIADTTIPLPDGTPLIIAVGTAGARELIEANLKKKGYIPGKDAWFIC